MQQTPRRESDARGSLSGDLLGKILRRTSHFRRHSNSNNNYYYYSGSATDPAAEQPFACGDGLRHDDHLSSPSAKGLGSALAGAAAAQRRRFSRAAEEPIAAAPAPAPVPFALQRMLGGDEPERQRRFDLEVMSFAALHEHFQPVHAPEVERDADDNQVEEELQLPVDDEPARRKSRETTADADDYQHLVYDEEDDVLRLRLKSRRAMTSEASASMEEDGDDDDDEDGELVMDHEDDQELSFDQANLGASVRKLVLQIENASFSEASFGSNQDEDDRHAATQTTLTTSDAADLSTRHSDPLAHAEPSPSQPPARRVTYPMVARGALHVPPPRVLGQSCYIPMDEVQEDLTKSVRRLVIGLKREAEAQDEHHHQASSLPFARRRGNSCPAAYTPPPSSSKRSALLDSSASTAASLAMGMMGPPAPEPPRWRKRSALARLAPKFLDSFRRGKRTSYLYTDEELESIEGARWKIVELAFRFGGKHRFYLVQAVNMFFPLTKYGRHGGPHATRLHCNRCGTLQWQHKRGGLSAAVDLADVLQIIDGRQTAVFRKYASSAQLGACSLSLVFKERTLDLETQSASHRDWLMSALRTLVAYARKQRQAEQRAIAERVLLPLDDAALDASVAWMRGRAEYLAAITSLHGSNGGPMMLW